MHIETLELDAVVIGGGIAGLWALDRLRRDGYSALLLEQSTLGAGQTIASQGIIHGGVKYALGGRAGDASAAIAAMPDLWRACLQGRRDPDLSAAAVLSDNCLLWTAPGAAARIAGAAASRTIRARPQRLAVADRPAVLRDAPAGVDAWSLPEPVVEPASLIRALAALHRGAVSSLLGREFRIRRGGDPVAAVSLVDVAAQHEIELRPRRLVLCAGAGNAELLARIGPATAGFLRMQRRPLHMVIARGSLPELYGHCVGASTTPLLTITSASLGEDRIWWIGGRLAEDGVGRSADEQAAAARQALSRLLPWVDFSAVGMATMRIDRAEAAQPGGGRPDGPVVQRVGNAIVCWPTKLALAPAAADLIAAEMHETPEHAQPAPGWIEPPNPAPLPWESEGLRWS